MGAACGRLQPATQAGQAGVDALGEQQWRGTTCEPSRSGAVAGPQQAFALPASRSSRRRQQ
jgi:hypothetical protein